MGSDRLHALGPLVSRRSIELGGARQRAIEVILSKLDKGRRGPEKRRRLRGGRQSGPVIAGEDTHLELAYPVPASGHGQLRIGLEVLLERAFIEVTVVERTKIRGHAEERSDQPKLPCQHFDNETKLRFPSERERGLCFASNFVQGIAARQQEGDQAGAGVCRECEIPGLLSDIERTPRQRLARSDMPAPGIDANRE